MTATIVPAPAAARPVMPTMDAAAADYVEAAHMADWASKLAEARYSRLLLSAALAAANDAVTGTAPGTITVPARRKLVKGKLTGMMDELAATGVIPDYKPGTLARDLSAAHWCVANAAGIADTFAEMYAAGQYAGAARLLRDTYDTRPRKTDNATDNATNDAAPVADDAAPSRKRTVGERKADAVAALTRAASELAELTGRHGIIVTDGDIRAALDHLRAASHNSARNAKRAGVA